MKAGVVLPESFLKCVSPQDRAKLSLGLTATEFMAKGAVENERRLQKLVVAYLRQKGIEPIVSRMDRRTSNNRGTPDILFAVATSKDTGVFVEHFHYACAWEVKHESANLKRADQDHQRQLQVRLSSPPNGWRVRVIQSLDEAIAELKEMGL